MYILIFASWSFSINPDYPDNHVVAAPTIQIQLPGLQALTAINTALHAMTPVDDVDIANADNWMNA